PEHAGSYDVLVLYDMWKDIPEQAQKDFIDRLKEGKGLVVLHHALCGYQNWPEYENIIGGRYYTDKVVVNGVEKPVGSYKHDLHFRIHVADPDHPVTRGIKDFDTHDETYKNFEVLKECHALLTTDEPTSSNPIAWSKMYEKSRVVYIQSGHDHFAYENSNYQRLVRQAIRWVARRE
ncbi:MAG TPA: ThuA domain-containing protein, partial [Candidatus Dormibacteraeota bacterium]|nr:ThuA domain-containing protein [Candidatus Dormibacteraeota bacterium]